MGQVGRMRSKNSQFPALSYKCTPPRSGSHFQLGRARAVRRVQPPGRVGRPTRAAPGPSWSCPQRGTRSESWSYPRRAAPDRAGALRGGSQLITGPSWGAPGRAQHPGRAGAVRRAPRPIPGRRNYGCPLRAPSFSRSSRCWGLWPVQCRPWLPSRRREGQRQRTPAPWLCRGVLRDRRWL